MKSSLRVWGKHSRVCYPCGVRGDFGRICGMETSKYRYDEVLGETIEGTPAEAEMLARCARECSRDAVRRAFAAGLSITVVRDGNRIVKVAPDGTETFIKYVESV